MSGKSFSLQSGTILIAYSGYYQNDGAGGYSTQSPAGSQGSPGSRGTEQRETASLRPVTANMVKNAQVTGEAEFRMYGHLVGHVRASIVPEFQD